jgi:hypothetical protein
MEDRERQGHFLLRFARTESVDDGERASIGRLLRAWTSIAATAFALMALGPGSAQAVVNPVLSGSLSDSATMPGSTAVAVAGHYAYVTGYYAGKLVAIDISNPSAPAIAGASAASNGLLNASTVNIAGGYAYVVSKNRNGPNGSESNDDGTGNSLTILDIASNPAVPAIVGTLHEANTLFGAYGVAMSGHYAFVASQGCLTGQPCPNHSLGNAFAVIDVSNPASPTIVAALHSAVLPPPWGAAAALGHATSVAISENYAYVTAAYQDRLTVLNIANPLKPQIVASPKDTVNLNFPVDVAVSGHYAYVVDQVTPGRLTVLDVSNPTNPLIVASLASTSLSGAYRIRLVGDFAYVSASSAADVAVVDISNPLSPRLVATVADANRLHKTTGLDVDPSGTHVVASSPYLTSQTQPLYPPFALQPGGPTMTGTVSVLTLDPSPIAVSISPASQPANPTAQTSANFSFSVNDAVAAVQCQIDSGSWLPCTTQTSQEYSALGGGSHTFAVRATDSAGNVNIATYTWTVTAPVNISPPSISGSAAVGQALSAYAGAWTGSPTLTYQWLRCDVNGLNCSAIGGATRSSYTAAGGDAGSTLEVQVTATTSAGSTFIESSPTAAVTSTPANTAVPTISGTATQGQELSASTGSWTGYPAPSFEYQWERCNTSGQSCAPITGANAATYTLTPADTGSTVLVVVTAINSTGSAQASSAASAPVSAAPTNTQLPTISGTATQGQELSTSTGSWTGYPAPSFAYQWERCNTSGQGCAPITGATAATYTLSAADTGSTVLVVVTASNSAGSAQASSAASAPVTAVAASPANTSPPTISGTATQGQELSTSTGSWTGYPAPSFAYQWERCNTSGQGCAPITGATAATYTLSAADTGSTVLAVVTAINSAGSAQASSAASAPITAAPANTSPPTLSGTATQGQELSTSTGSWTGYPAPSFAYQWERCNTSGQSCAPITGANAASYTLTPADTGSTVLVTVTAINSAGSAQASSAASAPVSAAPTNTSPPTISGTATEGGTLTAAAGSWSGYPAAALSYQWQRCNGLGQGCVAIAGATASSYTPLSADVGSTLLVVVTASNSVGSTQASSAASSVVVSAAGPLTPLLDNFARANNSGPPGTNWTHMVVSSTSPTNDLFITNQQVTGRSGSNADFWNPQTYGPNSEVWVTVAVKPNLDQDPVVLGLRFQNPGASNASGYQAYYIYRSSQADQYKIISRTNGTTSTTLASVTGPTLAPGDQLLFRAIGSTLELWRFDAGAWTRILSATDSTFQGAGYLNLTARDGAVRLTNFGGGTLP